MRSKRSKIASLTSEFDIDDYMFEHETNCEDLINADIESIVPGFVGWVRYGGKYLPGEVILKNVRKKLPL